MSSLFLIGYIVVIIALFAYIFSSSKKSKQRFEQLYSSIEVGNKIVTKGGIIGEVMSKDDTKFEIKSASSTLEFDKSALARIYEDIAVTVEETENETETESKEETTEE